MAIELELLHPLPMSCCLLVKVRIPSKGDRMLGVVPN
jgi:hypothetical protein